MLPWLNHSVDLTPVHRRSVAVQNPSDPNRYGDNMNRSVEAYGSQHNVSWNGKGPAGLKSNHTERKLSAVKQVSWGANRRLKPLRPLPIYEKELVYNEWGAVIKHQDDLDREAERKHKLEMKDRQHNYKAQLDW